MQPSRCMNPAGNRGLPVALPVSDELCVQLLTHAMQPLELKAIRGGAGQELRDVGHCVGIVRGELRIDDVQVLRKQARRQGRRRRY